MLFDLEILSITVAVVVIIGVLREAHGRMVAHGALKLAWRWHTGQPWHGKPLTDAGWFRPATDKRASTVTGHAARFHYLPRWKRTVRRTSRSVAVAVLAVLWYTHPAEGLAAASLTAALLAGYAGWRSWRQWQSRAHRRTWLEPLHLVAAPLVGIPVATSPGSWLEVEPDRSRAVAALPPGYNPDAKERERLALTFASKLGIESPEVRWQLAGPSPRLELAASQPPPAKVMLGSVSEALAAARPDELVWGLGKKGVVVKTSLSGDSPHIGLSMGSGAGKSETAKSLLVQQLHRGAIGLILDYKMTSHPWAKGLPNVVTAVRIPEIHRALIWLAAEVGRRKEVAYAGTDLHGNVHADVGPRIIVVLEELNAMVAMLRSYWREIREKSDPTRSPALTALDEVSFTGRSVLVNEIYIGQRLSDKATGGGGDARENIGVIAFARYRPSTWKMLAPDFPMPPKTLHLGRLHVVSDQVQETQGILMTTAEARELAVSGTVSPLPYGMPGARVTASRTDPIPAPDQPFVLVPDMISVTAGPVPVTLSEAVREGIVRRSLPALRIARHRGQLPEPVGLRGTAQEYDPVALAEWDQARR